MRITITTFAAMGLLALGGCGSKDASAPGAPKSTDEVKQEAAKLETPEPGQYRQRVEITRLDAPGIPKEAAEQMKTMLKSGQETLTCLTKAEADKGYRDMFKGVGKGDQCTYSRFDVDGGHLDAQMECTSPQQGKATMKLAGTVTKNGSAITIDMDASGGPAPMSSMKMTMHMTTTRLGDCKAS